MSVTDSFAADIASAFQKAPARPVQLQVNNSGAWKTVLRFDAGDDAAGHQVQQAVQMLHQADPGPGWRIATRERLPVVLMHLSRSTYGLWIARAA